MESLYKWKKLSEYKKEELIEIIEEMGEIIFEREKTIEGIYNIMD